MGSENNETKKQKQSVSYPDLLKYPVITICIVLGIIGLNKCAGIKFDKLIDRITKISSGGLEFESNATKAVGELDMEISQLKFTLDSLIAQNNTSYVSSGNKPTKAEIELTAYKETSKKLQKTEIAGSTIARLSILNDKYETTLNGEKGFIWLGGYRSDVGWLSEPILSTINDNSKITSNPNDIAKNQNYLLTQNIRLRMSASDNADFIGIIPENTTISFKELHGPDDMGQYWGEIKVVQ
ncbi:hypothetical protein LJC06_02030 [Bacteroidales bacterium OttesenSCG-928-I14]|nr:hypothetical protein [Bacteroidales bacterium OttesenSCG-928-I14]